MLSDLGSAGSLNQVRCRGGFSILQPAGMCGDSCRVLRDITQGLDDDPASSVGFVAALALLTHTGALCSGDHHSMPVAGARIYSSKSSSMGQDVWCVMVPGNRHNFPVVFQNRQVVVFQNCCIPESDGALDMTSAKRHDKPQGRRSRVSWLSWGFAETPQDDKLAG